MADIKPSGDLITGNQNLLPESNTTASENVDLVSDTPYKLPSSDTTKDGSALTSNPESSLESNMDLVQNTINSVLRYLPDTGPINVEGITSKEQAIDLIRRANAALSARNDLTPEQASTNVTASDTTALNMDLVQSTIDSVLRYLPDAGPINVEGITSKEQALDLIRRANEALSARNDLVPDQSGSSNTTADYYRALGEAQAKRNDLVQSQPGTNTTAEYYRASGEAQAKRTDLTQSRLSTNTTADYYRTTGEAEAKRVDLIQAQGEPESKPPVRGSLTTAWDESYPKASSIPAVAPQAISPEDHFRGDGGTTVSETRNKLYATQDDAKYMKTPEEHFIYDANDPKLSKIKPYTVDENGENPVPTFSGSATHINPLDDPEIKQISDYGYATYADSKASEDGEYAEAPVSPFVPFTRMDPIMAQKATISAYNRFHIPVADNEFRKGFRHIFITRPECYVCCIGGGLSEQAAYDEDFASAYTRAPYLCELLSPSYITPTNFSSDRTDSEIKSNFNFLLSNRVLGMTTGSLDIGVLENVTKSIPGYTVTTPSFLGGVANGSLELSFRDTKNLEVSEFIRLWILYMHKRHSGIFSPPYNGYQRVNGFISGKTNDDGSEAPSDQSQAMSGAHYYMYHPYDRAIEYPCTIFDIVTDETDSKILYMCTYMGAYPAQLSSPLTNENNAPITEAKVSVTFRYQARIENRNTCMVLFNHNAGITDEIGRPVSWASNIDEALPILINAENEVNQKAFSLGNYIGAASMFVGSPYIVIGASQKNPMAPANSPYSDRTDGVLYKPYLKFMPINAPELVKHANLGIQSIKKQDMGTVVAISQDYTDYSTNSEKFAKMANDKLEEYAGKIPQYALTPINEEINTTSYNELEQWAVDHGYELTEETMRILEMVKSMGYTVTSDGTLIKSTTEQPLSSSEAWDKLVADEEAYHVAAKKSSTAGAVGAVVGGVGVAALIAAGVLSGGLGLVLAGAAAGGIAASKAADE